MPIAFACLTFMLITRAIGTTHPPNPALRGFVEGCEEKPQPCWYGIVPGMTKADETQQILEQLGYKKVNQSDNSYTLTFRSQELQLFRVDFEASCNNIQLDNCASNPLLWIFVFIGSSGVTVGDILMALGQPNSIGFNPGGGPALFYDQLDIGLRDWVSPWHKTEGFEFYASLEAVSSASPWRGFSRWHGFKAIWRYCQIEPALPEFVCG